MKIIALSTANMNQDLLNDYMKMCGHPYTSLIVPQHRLEDHLQDNVLVVTFGKLAQIVSQQTDTQKFSNVSIVHLPTPDADNASILQAIESIKSNLSKEVKLEDYYFVVNRNGQKIVIDNGDVLADIHLTTKEIETIHQIMDVLHVEQVELRKVTDGN